MADEQGPLAGTVSLVTGSGRRTGRVIAHRLAAAGARVVLAARTTGEIDSVAEEIREAGGDALPLPTDVTSEEQVEAALDRIGEECGRLDHLVNAAGVYLTGDFLEYTLEDWRLTLDTYLTAPFLCSRAAARRMRDTGGGHVINISSLLVEMAPPGFEAYNAAKAGIEGFSRSLAKSLRPHGIKVSVVVPGAINAAGGESDPRNLLEMEDVADIILYLLTLPPHVHIPEVGLRTVE